MVEPRSPRPHTQTQREALRDALRGEPRTARELSEALSMRERDVVDHLGHLELSLERTGERLSLVPARCLSCRYDFDDRTRLTKPSRCPECKSSRIAVPRFQVVPA